MATSDSWEIVWRLMAWFCHQLPERSFGTEAFTAPLCYRCSAFYIAYVVSVAAVATSRAGLRPVASLVAGSIFVTALGADVYFLPSTNVSRVATGLLAGAGVGLVAGGLVRRNLGGPETRTVTVWWCLARGLLVAGVSLTPLGLELPKTYAILSMVGILAAAFTVTTILVIMSWRVLGAMQSILRRSESCLP